jgi:hypothetical protein
MAMIAMVIATNTIIEKYNNIQSFIRIFNNLLSIKNINHKSYKL